MTSFRKSIGLILALGVLEVAVVGSDTPRPPRPETATAIAGGDPPPVRREARRPRLPAEPDGTPPDVRQFLEGVPEPEAREFLGRVLARVPAGGEGVAGYRFDSWPREGKPTHEAMALKAVPGTNPEALIARVMDVDGYPGKIAYVKACRSRHDPAPAGGRPGRVRFYQVIRVPAVAEVQQELVLVDAGRVGGYRVAYWSLLGDETGALERKNGARSAFNVGAWLAAPGVVGYAVSSWPRRGDLNLAQWTTLTVGADAMAKTVVEGNIDGMAARANEPRKPGPPARAPNADPRD